MNTLIEIEAVKKVVREAGLKGNEAKVYELALLKAIDQNRKQKDTEQ
jgi:hypothetical protein